MMARNGALPAMMLTAKPSKAPPFPRFCWPLGAINR
jgi:hypothetical protein